MPVCPNFPTAEVLGPACSEEAIKTLIDLHRLIFIAPMFKGGIGKKGKDAVLGEHGPHFSISDSTHLRASTMTPTHGGGMDVEELVDSVWRRCLLPR